MPLSSFHVSPNAPAHKFQTSNVPLAFEFQMFLVLLRFERISLNTALLSFRDFFRYVPIIATRSSKLWHTYSKHCFCYFETWRFTSFRSKRLIHLASNNIIKIFSQQISPLKYVFRFLWEIPILNTYTRFWWDFRIIVTFNAFDSSHVNHNTF